MKRSAIWYWHRLRAVSAGEAVRRAVRVCQIAAWRHRRSWPTPTPGPIPSDHWTLTTPPVGAERDQLLAEAKSYLRGDYRLFDVAFNESIPDWHRDPQTGRRAPMTFAFDIDFQDPRVVGNIKTFWEKNRHQHLSVLALAFALTRDERFACEIERQLRSWIDENPFPLGVNWASPLELGVRLIAWRWIERLLRGAPAHDAVFGPRGVLWPAIYRHQWLIAALRSCGSSANNHLIGEMAGLFIAATAWPVFAESKHWRELARQSLEEEIIRQTFSSGLNREMAYSYHVFTFELFLLAWLENPKAFSPAYTERLQRMNGVMTALADCAPNFGDCDEAHALRLRPANDWLWQLCGNTPTTTEDAGLFVLRHGDIAVLADAGPHGFGNTAAHAHADALAFTLSVGGVPVFVDSGTYDYLLEEDWRDYFRSTHAHNTVVVDGLDQSTQAGPFLWSRQAKTTVESWDGQTLVASHDGYSGIIHCRRFTLRGSVLEITDTLEGSGEHQATLLFHLAPECVFDGDLKRGNVRVRMKLPAKAETTQGWYSPRFGVKKETTTIEVRWRGPLPVTLTTVLEISK